MTTAGVVLALLGAVAIIVIGLLYVAAPHRIVAGFGLPPLPAGPVQGWYTVKGVRDIASGLIVVPLLALGSHALLGWVLLVVAITPAGDCVAVLRNGGPRSVAYGVHGATAAFLVLAAALLLLG